MTYRRTRPLHRTAGAAGEGQASPEPDATLVTCSNCGVEHSIADGDCPACGSPNPVPENPESLAASPAALVDTDNSWRVPPEYRGPLKFLAHLLFFGVLIDHILVRGCATDHTVRASPPLRQELPSADLILPQPRLKVLNCRWFLNHGFETIEGEVENLARAPIDRVMAVASFYDAQGVHVEDQASVLRYSQREQRSSFRIVVAHNPRLVTLKLSFRFLAGGAVTAEPASGVECF